MRSTQTPIKLLIEDWEKVRQDIIEKNGVAGSLSWRLKREHGWTWRQSYFGNPVEIDFWTNSAKAMFLLTYSHLIVKSLKMYGKKTVDLV